MQFIFIVINFIPFHFDVSKEYFLHKFHTAHSKQQFRREQFNLIKNHIELVSKKTFDIWRYVTAWMYRDLPRAWSVEKAKTN